MNFFRICLSLVLISLTTSALAQMPGGAGRGQMGGGQNMNLGHFYGKIIDSTTNKPVDAASVQLIQNKLDTMTKKRRDVVVSGMLTTKKGEFSLENLNIMAQYKLKITAIGYKTIERKVAFSLNMSGMKNGDMSGMLNSVDKDLGNIKLDVDALQLQNVTVVSNKPLLTMSIDRKVFNVEKNLTSVGGTAVDVMKNVPSVNVDIDGNVTMRNAAPQIFVDGRPTTMTLDQIPADAIASVELITNPSAKYDASGGGAGILNIVLKKNRKAGYNGNIRASIDSRGRPGFGGDINVKQEKVNFFAAGMLGIRKSKSDVTTERTDFFTNNTAHSLQMNNPVNKGFFAFGRIGMDYFLNNRNTFTIGGNVVRGQFKTNDFLNSINDTTYSSSSVHETATRASNSVGNFRNYGSTFSYKHNYAKAGKELTADVNFNYSKNDNESDNDQKQYTAASNLKGLNLFQNTTGGGTTKFLTIQTDYSNPITEKMKIEFGARASFRDFTSFNTITNIYKDYTNGQILFGSNTISNYKFTDAVYAGYTTFSQQLNKFTYQLGLRLESSEYNGNLITKNQKFSNSYPFSLFPSAFFTYKLTDKQDMQLNYSRKINRPNFFQLIPFVDVTDPLNISKGNPDLIPEFTNLAELSYQNQLSNKHSFLTTLYFRNTNDLITRYQYRDANPNPAISDSATFNTYANANSSFTYGLELTVRDKFISWWDLSTNLNLYKTQLKAGNIPGSTNQSQVSWFAKINNSFKLPKNYSIQLSGDYQAKTLVPASSSGGGMGGRGGGGMMGGGGFGQASPGAQGYIKPNYGVDIAIKKDFMKNNAASLTLQMSDVFRTKLSATHAESSFLIYDSERRRDPQVARLSFNWRFGKVDVSLFKRKNMKGEMDSMQNAQQGMGN
ncbi:TonB-dependent receptor domain-containing protein [Ferruginibacter sp. SUN106]|uniref:TonB-dependent receptor domain-containing protein n=1 Tax=Ferruginibacter sp. SUN106 TaxID=2978348 RepID=UPI003D3678A0